MSNLTLPEKVIEHLHASSTALTKQAKVIDRFEARQKAAADMVPQVLDVLLANERITEAQREKVANLLRDPANALGVLIKVAQHRNASEVTPVTPAVQAKQASAGVRRGQGRPTSNATAALFRGLGLPVPLEE